MAKKEDELELDVKAAKPGGKGKLIMLIAAIILVTTGLVIGALYFLGMLGGGKGTDDATDSKHDEKKELAVKPAFYLDLKPAFVVNFEDQTRASYLQVEMQVMARSKEVLDEVSKHMPLLRNNILLILSAQKFEQVKTRTGKEQLQQIILDDIKKVVSEARSHNQSAEAKDKDKDKTAAKGAAENVEQVYFTSFIMQ